LEPTNVSTILEQPEVEVIQPANLTLSGNVPRPLDDRTWATNEPSRRESIEQGWVTHDPLPVRERLRLLNVRVEDQL
jgi:hypothetical protein